MNWFEIITALLILIAITIACAIGGGVVLYRNLPDVRAAREAKEERDRLGI